MDVCGCEEGSGGASRDGDGGHVQRKTASESDPSLATRGTYYMGEKHLLVNQRSARWLVVLRPHVLLRNVFSFFFFFFLALGSILW